MWLDSSLPAESTIMEIIFDKIDQHKTELLISIKFKNTQLKQKRLEILVDHFG